MSRKLRLSSRSKWVLTVLAVVLMVGAIAWFNGGDQVRGDLDPADPGRGGAKALAEVLRQQSIPVEVVRSERALIGARIDGGTTVVVTAPEQLSGTTLDRMRNATRAAKSVVFVGEADVLGQLFAREPTPEPVTDEIAARCEQPLMRDLVANLGTAPAYPLAGQGCFASATGVLLTSPRPHTWLFSGVSAVSNRFISTADNAAIALRLFGQGERVVWYVPDWADVPVTDATRPAQILPKWLFPALLLLALAFVVFLFQQGRRFGPLAVEPLPVVVRSTETTYSRGRLYERSRDRAHVAAILRRASLDRLRSALKLPGDASRTVLIDAVANVTGREATSVAALLVGTSTPTDDQTLTRLGQDLLTLEDEVRR